VVRKNASEPLLSELVKNWGS